VAVLKILKFPHPVLRQTCEPVTEFDAALQQLAQDMVETMYDCNGAVGLAAPQVGHPVRMVVIDINAKTDRDRLMVLVNPVVVSKSRNKLVREGCLSFPEYLANVKRATKCTVEAYDPQGNPVSYTVEGLEAVAVQHEIDHLDGVLMIDRVTSLATDWIRRRQQPSSAADSSEASSQASSV
jgi:peptide deformylase